MRSAEVVVLLVTVECCVWQQHLVESGKMVLGLNWEMQEAAFEWMKLYGEEVAEVWDEDAEVGVLLFALVQDKVAAVTEWKIKAEEVEDEEE
ncbi:uncharacterized protein MONOS_17278 [Monocercomonoides exilis]|uniref:uncharacterized protein n=1 Tax=Monocercomonoides exilis TaxID=2049356 RepID=UPI00355991E2|nr:hypothetical protein MONOS_17278 [Monocercomonoides exilis]